MSPLAKTFSAFAVALVVFASSLAPASAACKKMGFLVNDYGKEGPTKDAQLLLDKHIAAWADKEGIVEYSVGKKTVECELFLDFIVFDEHTCTASATVCWGGSKQPKTQTAKNKKKSKSKTKTAKSDKKSNKSRKSADKKSKSKVTKTVAEKKPEPKTPVVKVKTVETNPERVGSDKAATVETSAIVRDAPAPKTPAAQPGSPTVPYAQDAVIRNTGDGKDAPPTVPAVKAAVAKPTTVDATRAVVSDERAAADRAAAAAERAAAAAERAATAAQQAAQAAKDAVAAGQASRAAVVEPIKPTKTP